MQTIFWYKNMDIIHQIKETSKGDRRRHSGRLDCQKPETVEKNT